MNLEEKLYQEFKKILYEYKKEKYIYIGLSGGNSLKSFYGIIKDHFKELPKYLRKKILFFYLDERIVSFDSEESNYNLTKKLFLNELIENKLIEEKQIIIPIFSTSYLKDIKEFHIGLIGIGEDGHIASLFPNTYNKKLKEETNFILIDNSPKPPSKRISISFNSIKKLKHPFLFFKGENKIEIYNKFPNEKNPLNIPACILKTNKNLIIYKDFNNS